MSQLNFFKNTFLLINNSFYCDYYLPITHFNKEITHFNKEITHINKELTHFNKELTQFNKELTHFNKKKLWIPHKLQMFISLF
jgi:hypothetical protein